MKPETGDLTWRHRPFALRQWNTQNAGKLALSCISRGYRKGSINGVQVQAHRVIWAMMTGEWPSLQIDHVNGRKSDNRWTNLRLATSSQNAANTGARPGSSRFKGVSWDASRSKWIATIRTENSVKVNLGRFDLEADAAAAYDVAAAQMHGEFAVLNFPAGYALLERHGRTLALRLARRGLSGQILPDQSAT